MDIKADANKVINKLVLKIAELEKQNAILQVNIEELVQLNNKMNEIENKN